MNRILTLIPAVAMCACSVSRKSEQTTGHSFSATTRTISRPDTIAVRLPVYSLSRTTADSVSELDCPLAKASARINPDGTLSHSLQTVDTAIRAPVTSTTVTVDSTATATAAITHNSRDSLTQNWPLSLILIIILLLTLKNR